MSVQLQQFRVVGVDRVSGSDVSVIVDAGTKAAAEVKAEQLDIETTHIVRIKQDEPTPPDEHELFSAEAAEALVARRTDKLIEEVVPPEEPRIKPDPPADPPAPRPTPLPPNAVVAAIGRPTYAAAAKRGEPSGAEVSGGPTFAIVLLFMLGLTAGAYFVLVHEPNAIQAQQ